MSNSTALAMLQTSIPATSNAPAATSTAGGEPGLQSANTDQVKTPEIDSTRFAHLAKKEAALTKEREAFKSQQKAHAEELEKLKSVHKKLQDFEELKSKDKLGALKLAGFTDNDIIEMFAQQEDNSTPEEKAAKAAQNEIQKFRDEQTKQQREAQEKRNSDTISQFRNDITKTISASPEKYELCNYNGSLAEELIYETVASVLEDSKELISVQEAADLVEQYYEDTYKSMSNLKKLRPSEAVAAAKEAISNSEPLKPEVSPRPASKTLSNKTAASVASTTTVPRNETPDQKKSRLVKKFFG